MAYRLYRLFISQKSVTYLLYISKPFPNIIKWFFSGNIVGQDDALIKNKKIFVKYQI